MPELIKLIECPRDAMQGWNSFIPTHQKIAYINTLLQVGFDTIDAGSFVSPKAIPQMADTAEVIKGLDKTGSVSKVLTIVANLRGAQEAAEFDAVDQLGFPFSISETFQQRNTNSGIQESLKRLQDIQELCMNKGKQLVVYLSMGFGNPYNDPYSADLVIEWANKIAAMDIGIISIADTVGLASPELVYEVTSRVIGSLPDIETGVHLHSSPYNWQAKFEAALRAGCTRVDGALKGIGGCPMAGDALVGNMDMELMIAYLEERSLTGKLNQVALDKSLQLAQQIFPD